MNSPGHLLYQLVGFSLPLGFADTQSLAWAFYRPFSILLSPSPRTLLVWPLGGTATSSDARFWAFGTHCFGRFFLLLKIS